MKKIISFWTGLAVFTSSLTGYAAFAANSPVTPVVNQPMSVQISSNGSARIIGTYLGQDVGIMETPTSTDSNTTSPNSLPATITVFTATLNSGQEVPTNPSPAIGSATVQVDANQTNANVSLSFSGLTSNETGAHIHGPAALGENAGILFPLSNGQITNEQITLTQQQYSDLVNGKWYVNVHSENYPNGEIRGQLLPISSNTSTAVTGTTDTTDTNTTTDTTTTDTTVGTGAGTSNTSTDVTSTASGLEDDGEMHTTAAPMRILVSAWGATWSVEVNEQTMLMRRDGTEATLDEMSIDDPITVVGIMSTSTPAQTPTTTTTVTTTTDDQLDGVGGMIDPTMSASPVIIATSIRDNAIQVRRTTGIILDATALDIGTFVMANTAGQEIIVHLDENTLVSFNTPNGSTTSTDNLDSTMRVVVTGLFNSAQNTIHATSVVARRVNPPVVTAPETTTPTTTSEITAEPTTGQGSDDTVTSTNTNTGANTSTVGGDTTTNNSSDGSTNSDQATTSTNAGSATTPSDTENSSETI